jgi:hypothetical protein
MNVRLKVNVISDGKNYPFDSVVDEAILPPHMRTKEYVAYDLDDMGGKVMILREVNFNVTRMDDDGVRTNYPVMRSAGELISVEEIPEGWVEGEDYKSSWNTRRTPSGAAQGAPELPQTVRDR